MTLAVFGEMTADRERIILLAEGPDHEVAQAARELELLTPLIKATDPPGALHLPASWPAVVQLAQTYGTAWRAGPALTAWITEQLLARTDEGEGLAVKPPPGLVPRSYQMAGARMIGLVGSVLIFDEPRTGKTITTILGLVERHAAGHPTTPVVVVCPAGVVDPWVRHFRRWAPRWRTVAWRGAPTRRAKLIGTADVYVVSYGTARQDAQDTNPRHNPLMAIGAQVVVADEVHALKSQATEQSRAVRRLAARARNFIGLSGTPITHHPGDLWPALYALDPGAYPSRERWVGRYCTTIPGDYAATVTGLDDLREPEFRQTLLGQYRRVARADVINEVPKTYRVHKVELPPAYRKAYAAMESDMLAELPDGGELSAMTVLAQMTRLSQLASAAADVSVTYETVEDPDTGLPVERPHTSVQLKAPSWKVDALLEILDERPGYAVVVFTPSKQLVMLAGEAAKAKGLRVGYVVGGQTAAARTATVDQFQARELDLLCATTGAGGTGLTLSEADTLVFLQRPWSIVESLQAEDRGEGDESKTHGTEIIDVIATNTIESRVRQVLKGKAGQLSRLVEDPRIVAELLGGAGVRDLRRAS